MTEQCEDVTTYSDSDWAGWKETRTSSSAGVALLGSHMLKACTRKTIKHCMEQRWVRIARRSIGSVQTQKGRVSFLCGPRLCAENLCGALDAKVTEHILHRQGIGRSQHTGVAHLWSQDEVRSNRSTVRRVKSECDVADLRTKGAQQVSNHETLHKTYKHGHRKR